MKCPKCGTVFIGNICPKCGYAPTEHDFAIDSLMQLTGIGQKRAEELYQAGFRNIESIAKEKVKTLAKVKGIGNELAKKIISDAKEITDEAEDTTEFVKLCPVCGAIIPAGANKCPRCGTPVEKEKPPHEGESQGENYSDSLENKVICPFCGALIPRDSTVCPVCGAALENIQLEEPKPMEDPADVLKRFFGVTDIPNYSPQEENQEIDVRVCPNCGAIVVNKEVCPLCGTPIPITKHSTELDNEIDLSEALHVCPNCGAFIPPDTEICPVCGYKIEENEKVDEISLGSLFSQKHEPEEVVSEPQIEQGSDIHPEELAEIEHELKPRDITEEPFDIGIEQINELIETLGAEKISEQIGKDELIDIENSMIKNIDRKAAFETKHPETKPPARARPTGAVTSPEKKVKIVPEHVRISQKLNLSISNFGEKEDILAFIPVLVSFLFTASVNFLEDVAAAIFLQTVMIMYLFLGTLFLLQTYITLKNFKIQEKISGILVSLIAIVPLFPYSVYIVPLMGVLIIYLKIRKNFDYWIAFTTVSIAFALNTGNGLQFTVIFAVLFIVYMMTKYGEVSLSIAKEKNISGEEWEEKGIRAFQEKNYYDAIYFLRNALKTKQSSVNILNTLGLAYGRIGNLKMAIAMFKKVIEINSKFKYAWNNLGNVYARMDDYGNAIKCYREALKIDPNYDDALLNMGYIMIRKGSYGEAMKIANKIKAIT